MKRGVGLSTDTDSELIAQMIANSIAKNDSVSEDSIAEQIYYFMAEVSLSYALLIMWKDRIYAVRDPWGNRPLCIGELRNHRRCSACSLS